MQSNITLYTDKVLTTDPVKTELVKKLLMEGHITFEQAISLLEKEVKTEYINIYPQPIYPYNPPSLPWISCDTSGGNGYVATTNEGTWKLSATNTQN